MVKHLLTAACAAFALSAGATEVVDYYIDYSQYNEFPFYVMGYTPSFSDGVMKASNPGSWYQFFAADGISTNSDYSYKVTVKVKSSIAGSFTANMGWGWGDGEQANGTLAVTTEWSEQTINFHNVGTGSCNVVMQPGTFEGDLEFAWLRVSHEDTTLDPALQCLIASDLDKQANENSWDHCVQYTFATPLSAGTYSLKYDVYGLEDGKGYVWGTVGGEGWYNGGQFEIAANQWNAFSNAFTIEGEMSVLNIVFGSAELYSGNTLYFDNFSLTKEGSDENLIENGDFSQATVGHWSFPSYLKYSMYIGNGPAHSSASIGAVEADENAQTVFYNLQGMRMPQGNLPAGIYVKVTGNKAEKIAVK